MKKNVTSILCPPLTNAITYDRSTKLKDATSMIHLQFKSSSEQNERDADVEQHRAVIDMYNAAATYTIFNKQPNRKMPDEIVFYIAHFRSDAQSIQLLNYCVKSVQLYYPHAEIVICESDSKYERVGYDISGVIWTRNPIQNSATIGCIKEYLVRYETTQKNVVFLQDSIILKGVFDPEKLSRPFGFIWYFSVLHDIHSIENDILRGDLFKILSDNNMDCNDYVGCFGPTFYGSFISIQKLWSAMSFEKYMSLKERGKVLMDLERIIGAAAFQLGLISSADDCSLCGDIFKFPQAFQEWYVGQSFEEIQRYPYKGPALKVWKRRWIITDK